MARNIKFYINDTVIENVTEFKYLSHQGREFIANGALENGAFCTVFCENFHKF
jgi:hypothetical protein